MATRKTTGPSGSLARKAHAALLKHALSYPGAWEDHPWGETVTKVKTKIFLFLGKPDDGLSLSVKLPESRTFALGLDWTEPTGYGLGKAGWVSARFRAKDKPPVDVLCKWIDESYRAVAPVKLVKDLDGRTAAPEPKPTRPAKKAARKR
jgi:predicted DNA-binding protein (MmcQ/YjbR family)